MPGPWAPGKAGGSREPPAVHAQTLRIPLDAPDHRGVALDLLARSGRRFLLAALLAGVALDPLALDRPLLQRDEQTQRPMARVRGMQLRIGADALEVFLD